MTGPDRDGAGQIGRLALGIGLAVAVAVLAYVVAGGAGESARDAGIVVAIVGLTAGAGVLLFLVSRRSRAVGAAPYRVAPRPRSPEVTGGADTGRGYGSRAAHGAPAARNPTAIWDATTAPAAPGTSAPRFAGAAPQGPPQPGTHRPILSPRRPWVVVGLGILAAILPVVALVAAGPEQTDEQAQRIFVAAGLFSAAPCLVAGMIAAWRLRGQLATWMELATGMVLGSIAITVLVAIEDSEESAGYAFIGLVTLLAMFGTVAFVVGWFLWALAVGLRRDAGPVAQPRR